jgi:hypothetical protein
MSIQLNEDLAYWIGATQSDGSLKSYVDKRGYNDIRISFGVSTKSLPMIEKFQKLSLKIFNRRTGIWKEKNRDL